MGKDNQYTQIPLKDISITDSFWHKYQKLAVENVIPYEWETLNDRVPGVAPSYAIQNFRIAAGHIEGEHQGFVFQDSDIGKWLEAAAYSLQIHPNSELEKNADYVIDLIGRAQKEDGYINTYYTLTSIEERWTNLRDNHELYCAGHLIEAAEAYYEATGKDKFLNIMCRYADHIDTVFGSEPNKKHGYPGHQEIELALYKLYKVTGNEKYLKLSKYFIDERGQSPSYFEEEAKEREKKGISERKKDTDFAIHRQFYAPVREQKKARGHAVRVMYMACGMTDVATETGDKSLIDACVDLWNNVTLRKMYVTGAVGADASGEAFSFDYDLPNDRAYAETCAAIGMAMWASRMLKIGVDSKYSDVMERVLYNGVISGISLDGKKYFYSNPHEVLPQANLEREDTQHARPIRQGWFRCACCPTNLARLLPSLGKYVYGQDENTIYTHLYVGSKGRFKVAGQDVELIQNTKYPFGEAVEIKVQSKDKTEFSLALRMPGWCNNPSIAINGEQIDIGSCSNKGYAYIKRTWENGDIITLSLPMTIKRVHANPLVRADSGKAAIQRGPLVYCIEEADNGKNLNGIYIAREASFKENYEEGLLNGIVTIEFDGLRNKKDAWGDRLYRTSQDDMEKVKVKAIPYYSWANRNPGEMVIWINEEKK